MKSLFDTAGRAIHVCASEKCRPSRTVDIREDIPVYQYTSLYCATYRTVRLGSDWNAHWKSWRFDERSPLTHSNTVGKIVQTELFLKYYFLLAN